MGRFARSARNSAEIGGVYPVAPSETGSSSLPETSELQRLVSLSDGSATDTSPARSAPARGSRDVRRTPRSLVRRLNPLCRSNRSEAPVTHDSTHSVDHSVDLRAHRVERSVEGPWRVDGPEYHSNSRVTSTERPKVREGTLLIASTISSNIVRFSHVASARACSSAARAAATSSGRGSRRSCMAPLDQSRRRGSHRTPSSSHQSSHRARSRPHRSRNRSPRGHRSALRRALPCDRGPWRTQTSRVLGRRDRARLQAKACAPPRRGSATGAVRLEETRTEVSRWLLSTSEAHHDVGLTAMVSKALRLRGAAAAALTGADEEVRFFGPRGHAKHSSGPSSMLAIGPATEFSDSGDQAKSAMVSP